MNTVRIFCLVTAAALGVYGVEFGDIADNYPLYTASDPFAIAKATNTYAIVTNESIRRVAGDLAGSNYTASAVSSASATQAATNTMFSQWFSAIQGRTNAWDAAFGWGDWSARVAALDGRSNTWNRAAAAAGYAYSPTNKPALGTDTVARALGWYSYSPTNRPSPSDIGAASLADISAALATGGVDRVYVAGTTNQVWWQGTPSNVLSRYATGSYFSKWMFNSKDIVTMPMPATNGYYTEENGITVSVFDGGEVSLYDGIIFSGGDWDGSSAITLTSQTPPVGLLLEPIYSVITNRTDYILSSTASEYVPITSGVSTNQTLVNASVTGDLAVDAIRGKTSAGTFIRSLSGAPCASFGLGSGSNVMITNTLSSGYFQHTGTLTLNGAGIWTPISQTTNALGKIVTITETNTLGGAVRTNFFSAATGPCIYQTGLTNTYAAGDDGYYKSGTAWPSPRFTVLSPGDATNRVLDNAYGLEWARNFNVGGAATNWPAALEQVALLNAASYGGKADWRLPNLREIISISHLGFESPCIPNTAGTGKWTAGDPFINLQPTAFYWTSTPRIGNPATVAYFNFNYFFVQPTGTNTTARVCACRTP